MRFVLVQTSKNSGYVTAWGYERYRVPIQWTDSQSKQDLFRLAQTAITAKLKQHEILRNE